ncbi:MAG TPA: TonB-dependent receptor [Puia sp.]|nr:TonB-dependent receptor [Puia sp.]
MRIAGLLFFLMWGLAGYGQGRFTVSGHVKDAATGEYLIGATVKLGAAGAVSNEYGFFSVTAAAGNYSLVASFAGYLADTMRISLDRNQSVVIRLAVDSNAMQAVVVSSVRKDANVTQPLMGVQKITTAEIANVPVLFGEKDVMKTLQLLPGVQSTGDGSSGFTVRGGTSAQNLILLDEAVVYNPDHLLGFFSTFNSDAIKDVTLYKGGQPAEYGGRLSSVVDIRMNDGNNQRYGISGGIGLIDSRLNFEGPIVKDEGSFTISARRTYADLFLKLSKDTNLNKSSLYFYDLNAKANYKLGDKDHLYLSGYTGDDNLGFSNIFGVQYGNSTGTVRWNHIFNNRLFSNTSLVFSKYNYQINDNQNNNDIDISSYIQDMSLKEDLQYYINSSNELDFGVEVTHHALAPGILNAGESSSYNSLYLPKKYSLESDAYISHHWSPTDNLHIIYGLRVTSFAVFGPGTFYTYDSSGNTIDSAVYGSGAVVKNYVNPEPRFSASWVLNEESSIKGSYARNIQNLHLLTNSTSSNPTDLWVPSSNNIKPEIADQESVGYYRNFASNDYEFSAEVYYKAMQNQIDYKNGAQLIANENVESQLLYGKGRAYGLELFLKKKAGLLTGWVSYTLSKTQLQIDGINNGAWYNASQDIPQNLSVVGMYKAGPKWTLSADFVYHSGQAVTYPSGKYDVNNEVFFYYTERNASRMPAYNRLDLAATVVTKKTAHRENSWTFSVYNAYDRANAYAIIFQQNPNNPEQTQAVKYTLYKLVPSITWNFKY